MITSNMILFAFVVVFSFINIIFSSNLLRGSENIKDVFKQDMEIIAEVYNTDDDLCNQEQTDSEFLLKNKEYKEFSYSYLVFPFRQFEGNILFFEPITTEINKEGDEEGKKEHVCGYKIKKIETKLDVVSGYILMFFLNMLFRFIDVLLLFAMLGIMFGMLDYFKHAFNKPLTREDEEKRGHKK